MDRSAGYLRSLRELSPMSTKSKLFVLTCSLALVVVMALGQMGVRASGTSEGKSTHEMSPVEINSLLAGDPGSTVTVSVVRARKAEPQKIVITRDIFSNPVASSKVVDAGIGYIKVDWFTKGKSTEVANLIRSLQKSGSG